VVVTGAGQPSQGADRESKEAQRAKLQKALTMATTTLYGCYDLHWASLDGRPMAIAPLKVPSRIALDSTHAPIEIDPPRFTARDLTPGPERDGAELRWRRIDDTSFELFIVRDGTTQRVPVAVASRLDQVGRRVADEASAMPSGARVLLLAAKVSCE
jgi:hypothetical protein